MNRFREPEHFSPGVGLTRRGAVIGTMALPALLAAPPALSQSSAIAVADTHVHLFNAADLPIAGFAKYTLVPAWIGHHRAAAAVIDFLGEFIGKRAISAQDELAELRRGQRSRWSPQAFGTEAAEFIDQRARPRVALLRQSNPGDDLPGSYRALREALLADANYPVAMLNSVRDGQLSSRGQRHLDQLALETLARKTEGELQWEPGSLVAYRSARGENALFTARAGLWSAISQTVSWAYMMLHSRRRHLEEYLEANRSGPGRPRLIINHLVDYDLWIDDTPRQDSGHEAQLQFFDEFSRSQSAQGLEIRTFAGFCPLKLAIHRRRAGEAAWYDRLKGLRAEGKVAGFKLYPPIGFRPWDNGGLADSEFDVGGTARNSALDVWRGAGNQDRLGPALDKALGEFYSYCRNGAVPIMAHGRSSNDSGPGYRLRANPKYWEQAANSFRLRLMLGHLIDDAEAFANSASNPPADASWPLGPTVRMLTNPDFSRNSAQVYGDLGYMPEMLSDLPLAERFFRKLKSAFGPAGLKRVTFGTDWIMFGRIPHHSRYLATVDSGMVAADYSMQERQDVLFNNARRFLAA